MGKKLRDSFMETGPEILEKPELLCERMQDSGYSERDILSVMLILKCCPAVATLLSQRKPDELEVNSMVRSAVMRTGLSVMSVRRALGILLRACGYNAVYIPKLSLREMFVDRKILPEAEDENEDIYELLDKLKLHPDESETLCKLYRKAEAGNAYAAYEMGQILRKNDLKEDTAYGLRYFQRAAQLGYGPANGAVADYLVRGSKPNFVKAAEHLSNPAALFGADGRQWIHVTQKVLEYRRENLLRHRATLVTQCVLLVALLMIAVLTAQPDVWIRWAVAVQLAGMTWTGLVMLLRPCTSCVGAGVAMMVSWLLMIFHL